MAFPSPSAVDESEAGRHGLRRGYLLAVVVLIGSLLMVFLYARSAGDRERQLAETEVDAESARMASLVEQRLLHYELALRGGVSLFASVSRPTDRQWRGYVEGLDIPGQFPGLMGLGYAPYLRGGELEVLQLAMRDAGQGLFEIRPQGAREFYGPVVYLEPRTLPNTQAIGYDMFSEPVRRVAMTGARDTGKIMLTAPVQLLQQPAAPGEYGLLLYAPIYGGGISPSNPLARRAAMAGWVYAPFSARAFVLSALEGFSHRGDIRIVDITDEQAHVIYTDPGFAGRADTRAAAGNGADGAEGGMGGLDPQMISSRSIEKEVYGRRWRFDFQAPITPASGGMSERELIFVSGGLASLLLFAVVLALAYTQSNAERLAARMSASYRRSEQRFRNAMLYAAAGHALLDAEGGIVEANPALAGILGSSMAALAGTRFEGYFLDDAVPGITAPAAGSPGHGIAHQRGDSEAVIRVTRLLRRSDGDIRHVELVYSPLPGELDSDVTQLVQVEDVTERHRAQAQVQALNRTLEARVAQRTRELTHANHELESFAYSVSHDLRAPLRSIDGFCRLLADRYQSGIDEQGRGFLARVRAAANRMDGLIDSLLKMSRISRGEFKRVDLDLSTMATDIVAELRQSTPQREVEVVIEPGLHASGDQALIRNLLQNLLENAWKFTDRTPAARIEFLRESGVTADAGGPSQPQVPAGQCMFLIRDNGAGFSQEYASKLFRPFQRLHGDDEYQGHGIGLATVKRIVERHGGTISAVGVTDGGAVFRFSLSHDDLPAA
ncbi:CHASE domain-containing protein [Luteimonas sp. RIT-PG2_3]